MYAKPSLSKRARLRANRNLGNGCKLGSDCNLGSDCKHPVSPLYLLPQSGTWPVYVSDPDKKLVGIGCEVHEIDWWLNGGAAEVRAKHNCENTAAIYDPALQAVAQLMGWNVTVSSKPTATV